MKNPLIYLLIIHKWVGKYPDPLPKSDDPKREVKEALILSLILMIATISIALIAWFFLPSLISETEPYLVNRI